MALPANGDFPQNGSLAGRWKLDEASGTRADSVGSLTLTDNNTVGSTTGINEANASSALAANFVIANSEYFSRADEAAVSLTGDMSAFAWVKANQSPSDEAFAIISKYDDADRSWYFDYSEDGGGSRLYFHIRDSDGDSSNEFVTADLGTTEYKHVGFTMDIDTPNVKFWINGVQQGATQAINGDVDNARDSAGDFRIGAMDNAGIANCWDGQIQDVLWWNVTLTDAEVLTLYQVYTVPPSGVPSGLALLGVGN